MLKNCTVKSFEHTKGQMDNKIDICLKRDVLGKTPHFQGEKIE